MGRKQTEDKNHIIIGQINTLVPTRKRTDHIETQITELGQLNNVKRFKKLALTETE